MHNVVIVGGGFGGLQATAHLARAPVDVTLVDRRNFHLFQPLTYQVATGALTPGEVAYPLRAVFKRRRNIRVLMAGVTGFDLEARKLLIDSGSLPYDTLIVAGGSSYSYFGHDDWRELAPEVKSLESALAMRGRILGAFEEAEMESDADRRRALLTFVIVGAGPTGVEMAGQIAELARDTLPHDFRAINPRDARVVLVETADRVLTAFPPSLSQKAARSLEQLGVTPLLERTVVGIDRETVTVQAPDGGREAIPARTVIWAAGVTASGLAAQLAELTGAEVDRAGRITVGPDLTLPGHPEVLALGDMVRVRGEDGSIKPLPGVAPVAMQQGRYAAKLVRARLEGRTIGPFHYRDKGNLATIGRARAVADLHVVRLSGFLAWITWLVVHLWYLVGFQNRLLVFIRWSFSFLTRGRGSRLITGEVAAPAPEPAARDVDERRQRLRVTAVGGPTALLEVGGLRLLTDPTFDAPGDYPRPDGITLTKTAGPAFAADELGAVDVVLLSHDHHADNLDTAGRQFLARVGRVLTTNAGAERLDGNAVGLEPWSSMQLVRPDGTALTVTAVPAQHGPDGTDHITGPVIGFVLTGQGVPSVYVSGDNASVDVVRRIVDRLGQVDVAILFAGGARTARFDDYVTLSSERAVEATKLLGARTVIPVHFDGWAHFTQDLDSLKAAFNAAGLSDRLIPLEPGSVGEV